jgi:beta-ureidopropionase / N-carbamoyl-L-amino-acid hydrolase
MAPAIDVTRLRDRLDALAAVGPTDGGGVCRLALTDEDRAGRDLLVTWLDDLGLRVEIDTVGNIVGTWPPERDDRPVMIGSHIDTVRTGGRFDGNLGVLAAIEVIETLIGAGAQLDHPVAVASFTGEEGARFPPDMLGSLAYAGGLAVEDAYDITDVSGARFGDELARIGYAGPHPVPGPAPHAYVELHIEQGPVLEAEGITIGAVTGVQGISWQEVTITGQANHAGTTPMTLRHDAGYAAARLATFARELAGELGPPLVATVGRLDLHPDLVNVVAGRAVLTVDLRHTDDAVLVEAERRFRAFSDGLAAAEGVSVTTRPLARFAPVAFDPAVIDLVEGAARARGLSVRRMPSGAGHDAQMLARMCPAGMVFVPSVGGVSHNPAELTHDGDLEAGAAVLFDVVAELAGAHTAVPNTFLGGSVLPGNTDPPKNTSGQDGFK